MRHFAPKQPPSPTSTEKVAEWAGSKKPAKKRSSTVSDSKLIEALDEAERLLEAGTFEAEAKPMHFVAIYADLYTRVYNTPPIDLGPRERLFAARLAKDLLHKDFGGSPSGLADFVSWTWTREKGRVKWRQENGRPPSRISWRVQFGRSLLADYRVAKATVSKELR
jgi:hypothetical protein